MPSPFEPEKAKPVAPFDVKKKLMLFVFLVPMAVALVIAFYYLEIKYAIFTAGLLVISGGGLSFFLYSLAKKNFDISVEREELRNVVLTLEDATIIYDREFKVLFFNPAAENLFDIKTDEIMGQIVRTQDVEKPGRQRLAQVIFPSLAPSITSRSKAGVYPQVVDLSFESPDMELRVITNMISDAKGDILGFMKVINDRTREQFLLRSKSEFVTVASHQLRGPVTSINWALESLARDQDLSEESQALVENALKGGQQLLKIIEDLINIAKIEEGRFGYTFEPTDIAYFINNILTQVMPQARRASIKVYFDQPKDPLPSVLINQEKMTMVFYNFLDNAIRYNVQNGEVVVKVEPVKDESFIQVSIHDTGIGIPPEQINNIFGKFFRAENAVKFQTEGSGLGLYINKNIILAHGGKLWAESEMNRGTTFYFTLPTSMDVIPERELSMTEQV